MTTLRTLLRGGLVAIAASAGFASAAWSATVTLFVGPNGSATASGSSAQEPLADLQAAIDAGIARAGAGDAVEIRVLPGRYVGQRAEIRRPRRPAITIVGHAADARPVFDGNGQPVTWLSVFPARGGGPLAVQGLEVARYATAISLNGARGGDVGVADVRITGNVFRSIGQIAETQTRPSTAAVRLVNAQRVEIRDNQFVEVRNREQCGLIHAVYLAHRSTDNLVAGNRFENVCGDAVRLRDASGGNRITDNVFVDAWSQAPVSDWYCDDRKRSDCRQEAAECPSFGNAVSGNRIEVRQARRPEPTKVHGGDVGNGCPLPDAGSRAVRQRFITQ